MNKTTLMLNLIISSISIVKPIDDSISNINEDGILKSIEGLTISNINEERLSIDMNKDDILSKSEIINANKPTHDFSIDIRYLKEPELYHEEILKIVPKCKTQAPVKSETNTLNQKSTKRSHDESKIEQKNNDEVQTAIEGDGVSKMAEKDTKESKTVNVNDNESKIAKEDDNKSKIAKKNNDESKIAKVDDDESKTANEDNDESKTTKEEDKEYITAKEDIDETKKAKEDNDQSKKAKEDNDQFKIVKQDKYKSKKAKEDKTKRSENSKEISEIESTTKVIDTEERATKYLDNPVQEEPEPFNSENDFDDVTYRMDYDFGLPNDESNSAWDAFDDIPYTRRMLSDEILKTKPKTAEEIDEQGQPPEILRTISKPIFKIPTRQNIYGNKMSEPVDVHTPRAVSAVIQTEDHRNSPVNNIRPITPMDLITIPNKERSDMGNVKFIPVAQRNDFKLRVPIEDVERTSEYTEFKTIDDFNSDRLRNAYPYVPPETETTEEPVVFTKLIQATGHPKSTLSFYPGNVYRHINIPTFIPYVTKPLNFNMFRYPNKFRSFRIYNRS